MAAKFLPTGKGVYDYISVDGRARVACLERALPLLKPQGGVLMLDNSDRKYYQRAFDVVPSWWLMVRGSSTSGRRRRLHVRAALSSCHRLPAGVAPRVPLPRATVLCLIEMFRAM